MALRKAKVEDIKKIHSLINSYAQDGVMLSRSLSELYENVRDFFVYVEKGGIAGCCSLHVCWEDLAEVKCLAVSKPSLKQGIGRKLVNAAVSEAGRLGLKKVFALTYEPEFFIKCGFRKVNKDKLPHKIWNECINCPKFPDCEEEALILTVEKG